MFAGTVDRSSGNEVYSTEGSVVKGATADGTVFDEFGAGEMTETHGVADRRNERHRLRVRHSQWAGRRISRNPGPPTGRGTHGNRPGRRFRRRAAARIVRRRRPLCRLLRRLDVGAEGDSAGPLVHRRLDRMRRRQRRRHGMHRGNDQRRPRSIPELHTYSEARSRRRRPARGPARSATPAPWGRSRTAATAAPARAPTTRARRSN